MISQQKLDFWIKNRYNVLFIGKHGVGKTSIVKEAFERANLNWMYFSASTMDPWVDMVGVPKEKQNEDGSSYLDLVRPREFQNDEVEALFFDEFNRSHKKIRNAVMELIQFKSINGKKFNNLKVVWAAINPKDGEDSEYDVEKLDPAQEDRFHVKINIPYQPSLPYLSNKYGKTTAKGAISWWKELPNDQKNSVSPRRLDYTLDIHSKNGDIRDVLPYKSNVSKLITCLNLGPINERLDKFIQTNDVNGARNFLQIENNFSSAISCLLKKDEYINFFVPLISNEKLVLLMSKYNKIMNHVTSNVEKIPHYQQIIDNIITANQSKKLIRQLKKFQKSNKIISGKPISPWSINSTLSNYSDKLEEAIKLSKKFSTNAQYKRKAWNDLISYGVPKGISLQEAERTLYFCNLLAGSSHTATLDKLSNFYGVLNHILTCIYETRKISWKNINNKHKAIQWKIDKDDYFASKVKYQ